MTLAEPNIASEYKEHKEIVAERVGEEYVRAGYSKVALDGTTVVDEEKMKARVTDVVSRAVVTTKKERSKLAVTNGELYATVFPEGPGTQSGTADDLDEVESDVRTVLMRKVWGLTNPSTKGSIQRRLGDGTLILCRAMVVKDLDPLPGVYVTDLPSLIMEDSLAPVVDKLVRIANDLRVHASMITARHPELEGRVSAAIGSGLTRARSAAQLPAFAGNGRKPAEPEPEQDEQE